MDTTLPPVEKVPAPDGTPLALRRWPAHGTSPRGTILLVHGLGEHSGRYGRVADALTHDGWQVIGYDQRGHGLAEGPRGGLRRADDLLRDLATIVDRSRSRDPAVTEGHTPFLLLGHSMGGVVAAQFVARAIRPVDGLILSSPALDAGLSVLQRVQLAVGTVLLPDVSQSNQLDPTRISHDPAVVRAYIDDPLVHDRITARLARALVDGGAEVIERASTWRLRTLLLWAGADELVSPHGSATFAAAAPKEIVHARCFDGLYHEIFNEMDPTPVFAELRGWLDATFVRGA